MSSRTSTILTVAGVTVLGGALAYAVYFDYKRRNDIEFRKKLRKDKKRADKAATTSKLTSATQFSGNRTEELRAALEKIRAEPLPATTTDKENYFMSQAGLGEQLCTQGPAFALPAALAFFRALRVYPSPVELIMLYQQSLPSEVFALIMELTNLDVADRVEGYYKFFPKKSMNVSVQEKEGKKVLVAEQDFEQGDEIYTEEPVIAVLDWDLQEQGTHCTHCLRLLHKADAIMPEGDRLNAAYCSKECQYKSHTQHHNLLFDLNSLLPEDMDVGGVVAPKEVRDKAQQEFTEQLKAHKKSMSLMAARYFARQITIETAKLVPQADGPSPHDLPKITEENSPEYGLSDHLERMRYIEVTVPENETKLICAVLGAALPGLEQSLTEERHTTTLGKVAYNAIGICYSGGRDDRPSFAERPEDQERTRTPYGTSRQIGSGLYLVSSYLGHSCEPSVRPSFSSGTSELHLVANRSIKKGEELTMAYVDVTQHEGESAQEARRRRRYELARGWRFKCECARCAAEADEDTEKDADIDVSQDESKVEGSVERYQRAQAGESPEQD